MAETITGGVDPSAVHNLGAWIERLAKGDARGGPDNSAITERGIRGLFYDALEIAAQDVWAQRVGLYLPSDTKTEKHRWLGSVPEPREFFGGLNATPLSDRALDVINRDFELTVEMSLHDWRRDKTGHAARKIAELALAWADHWNTLGISVLENNDTAYDSVAMFATTHSIGSSGTLTNLLTASDLGSLNVSDTNRPTKAEAAAILADLAAYMYRFKDDQGRPSNQAARNFMLLCHPACYPGFRSAIADQLYVQGGSNELRSLGQTFDVVADARLASDTVVYMFRTDGIAAKPLILQEEKSPMLQVIGEDSEHAIKNNSVLYVSKACRAAAPGEFRHAIKATMS